MEMFERLDTWFTLLTVGILAWTLITNPRHVAAFVARMAGRSTEPVSSVSPEPYDNPPAQPVEKTTADRADAGLSGGLSGLSGLQRHALFVIMLDSEQDVVRRKAVTTSAVLVEALVAAGWKTGEIRSVLKGDNNVLGQQIQQARERLGLRDERVVTVGRGNREVSL